MPELPELVVLRDALEERIVDRRLVEGRPTRPGIVKTIDPPIDALAGERIAAAGRRGKHLILTCRDDLHLVVHLMVAGRLVLCRSETRITKATGFVLRFEDGEDLRLIENGHVKRAKIHLVADPLDVGWIAEAGPEALSPESSIERLVDAFAGRRQQLKKVLTDQRTIAGIGTAYADEICFVAKLSPIRYVSTLTEGEISELWRAIGDVLTGAIDELRARSGRALPVAHERGFLRIHNKTGQPCPECGAKIAEIRYAQTRTYYCPQCQSGGAALRDRRAWLTR